MRPAVDLSFYEETQLDDDEIIEHELARQAWAARDAVHERERLRKRHNFAFKAGML